MSVFLLRLLAAVLGFLLLVVIAVGGIVVAIFCLRGDSATLSLDHLASLISLPDLRDKIGPFLESLEADGPAAALAALCGAGAILLGIGLLVGALVPRRERVLIVERGDRGTIAARRRAAADALADLAERPREILSAKAKVSPNRKRAGGRARIKLTEAAGTDERPQAERSRAELDQLGTSLSLKLQSVRRAPRRGGRAI
jgi:hypothetical protein